VKAGADVSLVGREQKNSKPLTPRNYRTHRMKLFFEKGFIFYAFFNLRLFLFLVSRPKIDILVANDLDTLPANFLVSKLRRAKLVYDSHEYFTEVPELIGRKNVRNFWLNIEKFLIPKLKYAYTVSKPIADIYNCNYGVDFEVIHNYPVRNKKTSDFLLPFEKSDNKILIYQGAVNVGRGLELLIDVAGGMEKVKFIIAGDGDIRKSLENIVKEKRLEDKVFIIGKIPFDRLHDLTRQADAGVSLEEDLGLNYRFAMPNKLFDYIQAGIPVLVSSLPEMKKVVEKYRIGIIAEERGVEEIRKQLYSLLFDEEKREFWKRGLKEAAKELCWKNEEKHLISIYKRVGLIDT
jgi:glycosyltransferase involved in cell wall biosynthesis